MTFQEIIETLNRYWAEQGCLIVQPYDIEVGAGTFNPATSLRTLGPEPWRVAYVEPSRRPTDGRYGENPYRLGHYYQYQVILKPAPPNSQDLYLNSLRALGLDPLRNDFRFVEDDWESPTLGASGLGWEVWCNGAEVTQYTYFQQIGSIELDPICVELTYGLERLAMYLQDVSSIFEIRWNETVTYGDVHHQTEVEYTRYYLEESTPELLFQWFQEYERECLHCVERGLVWPALDYVLKASHAFNMLDARGLISVSERAHYIARVRNLMRRVARAYVEQRAEMGHPLTSRFNVAPLPELEPARPAPEPTQPRADLLFEIGTEEIPAGYIEPALRQMEAEMKAWLAEQRLGYEAVYTAGTPRRLTLSVRNLATVQEDVEVEVAGPPRRVAYDAEGRPTRAAEGFARAQGVPVDSLFVRETERGEYVFARKRVAGRRTGDLLAEFLPELVRRLRFPKSMRWDRSRFARPIRWIVALLGDQVVDFPFDTFRSGRTTRGHRFLAPRPTLELPDADFESYKRLLRDHSVTVDIEERRERIRSEVARLLHENDSPEWIDETLLAEVLYLVENPEAILGTFREEHLRVPQEVLITAMKKHQRYFPVYRQDGRLQPKFIALSNGTLPEGHDNVRYGNERVLRARLEDAAFYWDEDRRRPLADRVEELKRITFQERLGTLYEKMERTSALADFLAESVGLEPLERRHLLRAARLAKADLTTHMVFEFPELQGVMGRYYALESNEPEPVAVAIEEHYLPLSATSPIPKTTLGALLSIADKVDTIVGYFGIGQRPSGSQDPYSLRRQAIGTARILLDSGLDVSLNALVRQATKLYGFSASVAEEVLAFFRNRLEGILEERGFRYDLVDAVLAAGFDRVGTLVPRLEALRDFRASPEFGRVYPALNRTLRILPENPPESVEPKYLREPAEKDLYQALQSVSDSLDAAVQNRDYAAILRHLGTLQPAIDRFFDDVLVMDQDETLRNNRLALLHRIARYTLAVADVTRLVIDAAPEG